MGIKLSTNFDIGAPVPVDSKLVVSTKAGLTTINENIWPEGYLTICLEDKQLYVFNKNNEIDAETGKFRKIAADIDTSLFEKKAQGFMTFEQYTALKEAGNIIEDVDYYIEDTTEDSEANKAINVSYDNANTTLSAVNVQEALTELNTKKQDIVHYTIMPDPNTLEVDAIIQYIGITNEQYKEGRFYKVVEVDGAKSYTIVDTCAKDYELKSEPMTQFEYDALEQLGEVDPNKSYYIEDGLVKDIPTDASTIAYNNAVSGLNTSNVQGAIDLLQSEKQPKGHYALKSQIPDTSNFVTKAVSNLINYYSKQQTYTKEEVQALLTNFSTLKMKIVDTLPSTDIETNVIYLIKDTGVDSYTQYAYINDVWATLGKTTVDLSNYYTKDESDSNFITESELNTALTDYIKSADLSVIAEQVSFDNVDNGFTADNVQDALEELNASKQDALSVDQLSVLDSGITADKVAQIQDNTDTLAETLQFKTTDVTDVDELYTENGLYILNTQTVSNLPTAEDSMGYCVEVIRYGAADDALVVQIAYRGRPTDEHPLYMRRKYAGVWSDWVGAASINDEAVNAYATLSSEKINAIAAQLQANIDAKASIDDSATALTSTWSSDKISKELGSKTYTTLGELGLDASATLDDVLLAMPISSSALLSVTDFTDYQSIFPYTEANDEWSRVYIVKSDAISKAYVVWFRKDGAKYAIANVSNTNKVAGWNEILTQKSDPYARTTYKVLNGTEDLFTLAPGHYVSANTDTAYNYPVTDNNKVTAHIYVIGSLNDPANNKGYRTILYFDNKNRMYKTSEWWGVFDNSWIEIAQYEKSLVSNSPTFTIDITRKNSVWWSPFKFTYMYDNVTCEIDFNIANGLFYTIKGTTPMPSITYTTNGLNIKIGIRFFPSDSSSKIYGTQWVTFPSECGTVTALTADEFIGASEATYKGSYSIKSYSSFAELRIEQTATLQDILNAMVDNSMFVFHLEALPSASHAEYLNLTKATVTIFRRVSSRIQILMTDKDTGDLYVGKFNSANTFAGWTKVCMDSTPTWSDAKPNTLAKVDARTSNYCVKNGICYVNVDFSVSSNISGTTILFYALPKPAKQTWQVLASSANAVITVYVDTSTGDLKTNSSVSAGVVFKGSLSYPVA